MPSRQVLPIERAPKPPPALPWRSGFCITGPCESCRGVFPGASKGKDTVCACTCHIQPQPAHQTSEAGDAPEPPSVEHVGPPAGSPASEFVPGLIYDMPDEVYHADPVPGGSLSSTFARMLTDLVPAKAYERRKNRKPTRAMNLGKAAHAHALGTGPELIVWEHDGRTKEGKAERAARSFDIEAERAVGVTAEERDRILEMAEALHAAVGPTIEASQAEVSAFWREGPIWARARYDLLDPNRAFDYKTCQDASRRGFAVAMAKYGYHQQAEWYARGLKALGHTAARRRLNFICQETEAPYIVQIHEPDDDAMEIARELNDRAIRIYAEATRTGHWPGPERLVNEPASLPPFYFFDHEDVIERPNLELEF